MTDRQTNQRTKKQLTSPKQIQKYTVKNDNKSTGLTQFSRSNQELRRKRCNLQHFLEFRRAYKARLPLGA